MVSSRIQLAVKMERSNLLVSVKTKNELRRDVLSLIIANPFERKTYELLKKLAIINARSWPSVGNFIKDFVWGIYMSWPILNHIASNKMVHKVLINPINRHFMKQ
jgi:hypothetical protein